jgi:hypothetical protein
MSATSSCFTVTRTGPMESAGAVDAKNAPTAPWKTHGVGFPQLPQAIITFAINIRSDRRDMYIR